MTISETTHAIGTLDLNDLDIAAETIAARGTAVVQFAASADSQTLLAAQTAGQALLNQLLEERRRLLTEIRKARSLRESLSFNVSEEACPRSLLGKLLA